MRWLLESRKGELHMANFFDDIYVLKVFAGSGDYLLSACGESRPVDQFAKREAEIDAAHLVHSRRDR